jgi:hypothetical protein
MPLSYSPILEWRQLRLEVCVEGVLPETEFTNR